MIDSLIEPAQRRIRTLGSVPGFPSCSPNAGASVDTRPLPQPRTGELSAPLGRAHHASPLGRTQQRSPPVAALLLPARDRGGIRHYARDRQGDRRMARDPRQIDPSTRRRRALRVRRPLLCNDDDRLRRPERGSSLHGPRPGWHSSRTSSTAPASQTDQQRPPLPCARPRNAGGGASRSGGIDDSPGVDFRIPPSCKDGSRDMRRQSARMQCQPRGPTRPAPPPVSQGAEARERRVP